MVKVYLLYLKQAKVRTKFRPSETQYVALQARLPALPAEKIPTYIQFHGSYQAAIPCPVLLSGERVSPVQKREHE